MRYPAMLIPLSIFAALCCLVLPPEQPSRAEAPVKPAATGAELAAEDIPPAASVGEARARARLLHETVHGALQVVHRDYFNEEDAHAIPSASLEDVFHELSVSFDVELRWLIVKTDPINVDHQPQDDFEKAAVEALDAGRRFEAVEGERYRFAGPIRLASQCLKCHVKNRNRTEDRTAGLLISMPLELATP